MILLLIIRKLVHAAIGKVVDAATLVGGENFGFVTVQEKDADTIASIVSYPESKMALLSTVIPILVPRPLLRKTSLGTFNEGEFIVLVYEK